MPNKDESPACIDIREDDLLALSAEVLDLIRLSVGIEDVDDILDDIKQALDKI